MNIPQYVYSEFYSEGEKYRYRELLSGLGENVHFEDDKWICDKRIKSASEPLNYVTIYFTKTPEPYIEVLKYYVLMRIVNGDTVRTLKARVSRMNIFLNFLDKKGESADISNCEYNLAAEFKKFCDESKYSTATLKDIWREVSTFMRTMSGYENKKFKNPFSSNPYSGTQKINTKYIPEYVATQLDEIFKNEGIDLYLRCIYWILRLVPSRISEVLGMSIECIKAYKDHYVLFIPTWKQNGGNMEAVMRTIHIEDKGISRELVSLIRKQQGVALSLQDRLSENKRGNLFAYESVFHYRDGRKSGTKCVKIATVNTINRQFARIYHSNKVKDDEGNSYTVTTHQFRHNGITDRLEAGFTMEQIADMTGHHGNAMIWNSYSHLDLKPKTILKKQQYVLEEPTEEKNPYVLFGGRILNMDEQTEKRLLKNIRALRVRGGICNDVTGCKGDMWNCLDCEHFIPEKEQLPYFREQIAEWKTKADRFKNMPIVHENSLKNAKLFEGIVSKLTGGNDNE